MKKSVAVVGLGRFGNSVAKELYTSGSDVLVIDENQEKIDDIANFVTCAIRLDICDPRALEEAGIGDMDVVIVAMSESLEASIMAIMTAKALNVKSVIAKAKDEFMGAILEKLGADQIIYPEKESGIRLCHKVVSSNFIDYFDISDTTSLVEMYPRQEWIGKSLRQLDLRKKYKVNVVAVMQNDDFNIAMDPDEPLKAEEKLLLTIKKKDLKRIE